LPRRSCASGSIRLKPRCPGPLEQLKACGLAHIDFLISHPRLEGLCWRDNLVNREDPALQEVLQRMSASLVKTMSAATGKALVPDKEANPSTLLAISVVNGFATLVNERMILQHAADSDRRARALSMAEEMLDLLSTAFGAVSQP
jgi:AcrR family transcriptional regulator